MALDDLLLDDPVFAPTAARAVPPREDVLRIDDLHVSVHDGLATAVRGVSLRVGAAETVGLVGESGSGKTLTCRAALGLLPAGCRIGSGSVSFAGQDVTSASRRTWENIHGSQVGAVFQDPASYLNPSLTVGAQLAEVLRVKGRLSRQQARRRAIELFGDVGLHQPERVFHQIPAELSGGMLQRAMVAIAISCGPRLLIADEATTALDVTIQAEVIDLLLDLRQRNGLAVMFVSHDLAVVAELCDRIYVFYAGQVVESGTVEDIVLRPRHPYTKALVRVASGGDFRRRHLEVIPGSPPQVGTRIVGCSFADRCRFALGPCCSGEVRSVVVGDQHEVRCARANDGELSDELLAV
jgi:peptide/nickel transport system ATP-binding protein